MGQQNQTKSEENQNKSVELSEKDLEQVSGGYQALVRNENIVSPRDAASGLPTGFTADAEFPTQG